MLRVSAVINIQIGSACLHKLANVNHRSKGRTVQYHVDALVLVWQAERKDKWSNGNPLDQCLLVERRYRYATPSPLGLSIELNCK